MLKQNWTSIVVWRVGSMGPTTRDIIRSPKCKLEGDGGVGGGGGGGSKGSLPVYQRLTLSPNFQQFSLTLYFTFSLVSIRYNGTIRVLSRIYHLGKKSWVAEGDKRPRGVRVQITVQLAWFARLRHFNTTTRILPGFAFWCKLDFNHLTLPGITILKYEGSGMMPSWKWHINRQQKMNSTNIWIMPTYPAADLSLLGPEEYCCFNLASSLQASISSSSNSSTSTNLNEWFRMLDKVKSNQT